MNFDENIENNIKKKQKKKHVIRLPCIVSLGFYGPAIY